MAAGAPPPHPTRAPFRGLCPRARKDSFPGGSAPDPLGIWEVFPGGSAPRPPRCGGPAAPRRHPPHRTFSGANPRPGATASVGLRSETGAAAALSPRPGKKRLSWQTPSAGSTKRSYAGVRGVQPPGGGVRGGWPPRKESRRRPPGGGNDLAPRRGTIGQVPGRGPGGGAGPAKSPGGDPRAAGMTWPPAGELPARCRGAAPAGGPAPRRGSAGGLAPPQRVPAVTPGGGNDLAPRRGTIRPAPGRSPATTVRGRRTAPATCT